MLVRSDQATRLDVTAAGSRSDLYRYREGPEARVVGRSERLGRHRFYRGILLDEVSLSKDGSGGLNTWNPP